MSALNRIKVGNFDIEQSVSIEKVSENNLIDIEEPLKKYSEIYLETEESKKYKNGVKLQITKEDGIYRIYLDNEFYGLGISKDNILKSEKCLQSN